MQSWEQRVAGPIRFTGLTTRTSSDTEGLDAERTVKADLYVFALQTAKEHSHYDPLDVGQWQFWVIPATTVAGWKKQSVGLTWLEAQSVPSVRWDELNDAVSRAAAP